MKPCHVFIFLICIFINTISLRAQQKPKHSKGNPSIPQQYFTVYGNKVKYAVYNTDTVRLNNAVFVTHTAEYVWDTINSGYIFVIKELRLFCDTVKPEILGSDIKSILSVIPPNGFKMLDKGGGEFFVNIEEALYDGGEDSVFIAVDINGFIGGNSEFEENGVIGLRYADLKQYNDSLYRRPDSYPMNRFGKFFDLK